jgi:hypothetical protein
MGKKIMKGGVKMLYLVQYHNGNNIEPEPKTFKKRWRKVEAETYQGAAIAGLHGIIKRLSLLGINRVHALVADHSVKWKDGIPTNTLLHCITLSWKQ